MHALELNIDDPFELSSDSNSKTDKEKLRERATEVLLKVPEVEEIYIREEAAASFHLLEDRIGYNQLLHKERYAQTRCPETGNGAQLKYPDEVEILLPGA